MKTTLTKDDPAGLYKCRFIGQSTYNARFWDGHRLSHNEDCTDEVSLKYYTDFTGPLVVAAPAVAVDLPDCPGEWHREGAKYRAWKTSAGELHGGYLDDDGRIKGFCFPTDLPHGNWRRATVGGDADLHREVERLNRELAAMQKSRDEYKSAAEVEAHAGDESRAELTTLTRERDALKPQPQPAAVRCFESTGTAGYFWVVRQGSVTIAFASTSSPPYTFASHHQPEDFDNQDGTFKPISLPEARAMLTDWPEGLAEFDRLCGTQPDPATEAASRDEQATELQSLREKLAAAEGANKMLRHLLDCGGESARFLRSIMLATIKELDPQPEGLDQIPQVVADLVNKVARLTEWKEQIRCAIGDHPDMDLEADVGERIGRLRDEARRSADVEAKLAAIEASHAPFRGDGRVLEAGIYCCRVADGSGYAWEKRSDGTATAVTDDFVEYQYIGPLPNWGME